MKTCPSCGYDSTDDAEFCSKCGEYFPKASGKQTARKVRVEAPEEPAPGNEFEAVIARWTASVKEGAEVTDSDYAGIVGDCLDAIAVSARSKGTQGRAGLADLAILLDERDLMTDLMSGLAERASAVGTQRELMNISNEYMFMAIESFSVYTDIDDLVSICEDAVTVFRGMSDSVGSLEPVQSKHEPSAFLDNYGQFFVLLGDALRGARDRTDPSTLEFVSDYWASKSGKRFSDIVMTAANMNVQLIGTGWLGSKVALKARDMQIEAFVNLYLSPKRE